MNDKIVEFISDIDSSIFDLYALNAHIDSQVDIDSETKEYDYSWLNQVEKYLPFVSNIVNMDYTNADIHVILSYENRFIRTLIFRLRDFLLVEQKRFYRLNFNPRYKKYNAKIQTKLDNEIIEIDLNVKSSQTENPKKGEAYGLSLKERIDRVIKITDELFDNNLMQQLKESSFIHNPVNKTPLMEEDMNYRKALELFNYIDNFNEAKKDLNILDIKENLNNKFLITSFLEYQLLNDCLKDKKEDNVYRIFLERLIEKLVLESSMDEKSFKKMLTKKFEEEYTKKKNREKSIQNIFLKNIDSYNKQVKDALRALKN